MLKRLVEQIKERLTEDRLSPSEQRPTREDVEAFEREQRRARRERRRVKAMVEELTDPDNALLASGLMRPPTAEEVAEFEKEQARKRRAL